MFRAGPEWGLGGGNVSFLGFGGGGGICERPVSSRARAKHTQVQEVKAGLPVPNGGGHHGSRSRHPFEEAGVRACWQTCPCSMCRLHVCMSQRLFPSSWMVRSVFTYQPSSRSTSLIGDSKRCCAITSWSCNSADPNPLLPTAQPYIRTADNQTRTPPPPKPK